MNNIRIRMLIGIWLILALSMGILGAAENVRTLDIATKSSANITKLPIVKLNTKDYIGIDPLSKAFKANFKEEHADKRIYLNIYDEQFIFLANSAFFSFDNKNYKLPYPLISQKGKYYLPVSFAKEMLPKLFTDKIKWNGIKLTVSAPPDYTIKTIVLDPGHGGKDPGAVGKKLKSHEKANNLAVCYLLKALLEKELGVKVLMTRTDDRFVSLQERTKFANENKADLFISIHTNASVNRSTKGIEVYYLSTAKTNEARAVEALENSVVERYEGGKAALQKYDDLALILSDIMQAENLEQSNNMAQKILLNMTVGTKAVNLGVKQANFYVLRGAYMPAVLIEMGFISNAQEEAYLINDQYRERLARTIFEGIKSFKYRYDRIRST